MTDLRFKAKMKPSASRPGPRLLDDAINDAIEQENLWLAQKAANQTGPSTSDAALIELGRHQGHRAALEAVRDFMQGHRHSLIDEQHRGTATRREGWTGRNRR